jgi:hypothetical protein
MAALKKEEGKYLSLGVASKGFFWCRWARLNHTRNAYKRGHTSVECRVLSFEF